MVRAGLDPWGELAERLYRWATESDLGHDDIDDIDDDALEELRRSGLALESARRRVAAELRVAGLIPSRRVIAEQIGYRVSEDADGRRVVRIVCSPDRRDPTVFVGEDARARALAVASGRVDGPVVQSAEQEPVKHPDAWAELVPRYRSGELPTLAALDVAVAERLGCTTRHARRVRRSWGIGG